mgnify:CR=1 FL=1
MQLNSNSALLSRFFGQLSSKLRPVRKRLPGILDIVGQTNGIFRCHMATVHLNNFERTPEYIWQARKFKPGESARSTGACTVACGLTRMSRGFARDRRVAGLPIQRVWRISRWNVKYAHIAGDHTLAGMAQLLLLDDCRISSVERRRRTG